MGKIYVSQLFSDVVVFELLKDKDIGLEIIEFGIGSVLDKEDNGLSDYLSRMGDSIKNRNLSLHGPFLDLNPASFDSLVRSATMQRFNQVYSVAKKLNADRIIFHSCFYEDIYFKETYVTNSIEFWKEFLADKDESIKIHIENVLEKSMDHLVEVVEGVNNDNLTICLDIGHANCYSDVPVEEWIKSLGNKIGHIHLHNNYGIKDTHEGLNKGNMDICYLLHKINEYCYNPSMTIEINDYSEINSSIEVLNKFL